MLHFLVYKRPSDFWRLFFPLQGDSGGSVVYKDGNVFRTIGIVSWGYTPSGEHAGVNTRVTSHLEFIQKVRDNEWL